MDIDYETDHCSWCDQGFDMYEEYEEGSFLCKRCYDWNKEKTVLILAIGCQLKPWDKMTNTSLNTWDSIDVRGVETIFYCGEPVKQNTDKIIYFPVKESYHTMGEKMLQAFEWALKNKSFDYVARINSSCYVDKKELIKYVQTLPDNNVFAGLKVDADPKWMWGGGQYVISRDVIQKIVDNKSQWNHGVMEDMAISFMANHLEIPYTDGRCCVVDRQPDNEWRAMLYGGGESFMFSDFNKMKELDNQFFYRVKTDGDRAHDEFIMNELFKALK